MFHSDFLCSGASGVCGSGVGMGVDGAHVGCGAEVMVGSVSVSAGTLEKPAPPTGHVLTEVCRGLPRPGLSIIFRLDWSQSLPSIQSVSTHPANRIHFPNKSHHVCATVRWKECLSALGLRRDQPSHLGRCDRYSEARNVARYTVATGGVVGRSGREAIHLGQIRAPCLPPRLNMRRKNPTNQAGMLGKLRPVNGHSSRLRC
jgi:hypothetical protein